MNNWKIFFKNKSDKIRIIITVVFLFIIFIFFTKFLLYVESRDGVAFQDPVHKLYNAIDLNIYIFIIIYVSIITGFIGLVKYPDLLIKAVQTYILMVIFRTIFMFLLPLNPPPGTIDLNDPFIFIMGTGQKITKDLFFSGHVSTMFILFLSAKSKILKYIFLISTILVGLMVIIQKNHYTIDVLVAPFVVYSAWKIVSKINLQERSIKK
jgi:hypothetical protein